MPGLLLQIEEQEAQFADLNQTHRSRSTTIKLQDSKQKVDRPQKGDSWKARLLEATTLSRC